MNVDLSWKDIEKEQIRSFAIPSGNIYAIDNEDVKIYLQDLKKRDVLIAGICADIDVLDNAGILCGVKSTHSTDEDLVYDKNIITAK